jgi:hypothetical protein
VLRSKPIDCYETGDDQYSARYFLAIARKNLVVVVFLSVVEDGEKLLYRDQYSPHAISSGMTSETLLGVASVTRNLI